MLRIMIPGRDDLKIENVVFDFNGTLATDGKLNETVTGLIAQIGKDVAVYILTADTYGTVRMECEGLSIQVKAIGSGLDKRVFVGSLGDSNTICIGNGMNDVGMFEASALSIAIMGREGCAVKAICAADIVVRNIEDAFELILKPTRITATLRE
jgi:soluble P-type ATPase